MANRPIKNFKSNGIDVAIWQGDFKGEPTYSVTIQRGYKTEKGYENTGFLRPNDLLVASHLLEQAFDYINSLRTTKGNDAPAGENW
jgi:hypothetical protein